MRSIQSRNRNLGIQNAQQSAKTIVRSDSDRPSLFAIFGALYGYRVALVASHARRATALARRRRALRKRALPAEPAVP